MGSLARVAQLEQKVAAERVQQVVTRQFRIGGERFDGA